MEEAQRLISSLTKRISALESDASGVELSLFTNDYIFLSIEYANIVREYINNNAIYKAHREKKIYELINGEKKVTKTNAETIIDTAMEEEKLIIKSLEADMEYLKILTEAFRDKINQKKFEIREWTKTEQLTRYVNDNFN